MGKVNECCFRKSAFVLSLDSLFLKHGLHVRTVEYQNYYAVWLFREHFLNVLLWFLVQPERGEAYWTDVIDNNNQLPILEIGLEHYPEGAGLEEILREVYIDLCDY